MQNRIQLHVAQISEAIGCGRYGSQHRSGKNPATRDILSAIRDISVQFSARSKPALRLKQWRRQHMRAGRSCTILCRLSVLCTAAHMHVQLCCGDSSPCDVNQACPRPPCSMVESCSSIAT